MTEAADAFDRAAEREFKQRRKREKSEGPLASARSDFHGKISGLVFFSIILGVHLLSIRGESPNAWTIGLAVMVILTFLGVVSAWGEVRVAEAVLKERAAREEGRG